MNWKMNKEKYSGLEVAVIGMAGRFPKARNVEEFLENLRSGREVISTLSEEELLFNGEDKQLVKSADYVKSGCFLEDKQNFDSSFFNYQQHEAVVMDPQIRIFHECVWQALEDAGVLNKIKTVPVGLFAGARDNANWRAYTLLNEFEIDSFSASQLNNVLFMPSLVSYKLNLKGPSVFINTACSTSLVAIHSACRSLLTGESKIAIAGGVAINSTKKRGYVYEEGAIMSKDGHCRVFDASASGTYNGEGVGVVVLKKLQDAIRDKDPIHAIIKGSAVNNDGDRKMSYSAPSQVGQIECIRIANHVAKVEPASIGYVEAHGTGTKLGDPIEVNSLTEVYGSNKTMASCALGSVKSNMGHLDAAAGVAGFIKTVLSLKHKQLFPSLNYQKPNPEIKFNSGPFYVNTSLQPWIAAPGHPLRAAVSSFGIGGTNAHVILEEGPLGTASEKGRNPKLLVLSAKTETALIRQRKNLLSYLQKHLTVNLDDMCYTYQTGRSVFAVKEAVAFSDREELLKQLLTEKDDFRRSSPMNNSVAFLFPGVGAQYANMGLELYTKEVVFRSEMDRGFKLLTELTGQDYRGVLYPEKDGDQRIYEMQYAQPLIYLFEYCLCRLLQSWGIQPSYLIGHSLGEYVAACIGGVFEFEEGLKLVLLRGALVESLDKGFMLSLPLGKDTVVKYLGEKISLAAVNGPEQTVVSGDVKDLEAFINRLDADEVVYRKLHATHAMHSYMLEKILPKFEEELKKIVFRKPLIPFVSNVTGDFILEEEALSSDYWLKHLRQTVMFAAGIDTLSRRKKEMVYIEVGPGNSLCSLLKQQMGINKVSAVNTVRHPKENLDDDTYLLQCLGQLWTYGVEPDWFKFNGELIRQKLSLPGYSFDPIPYTAEVDAFSALAGTEGIGHVSEQKEDLKDWIYYPIWKNQNFFAPAPTEKNMICLLFSDQGNTSEKLRNDLKAEKHLVVVVKEGDEYHRESAFGYTLNPRHQEQYGKLFNSLLADGIGITDIIHCWTMGLNSDGLEVQRDNREINLIYFSIVNIAKAFLQLETKNTIRFSLITSNLYQVLGSEDISYSSSLLVGLLNVMPQEYGISCKNIDVDGMDYLRQELIQEIQFNREERVVAWRNGRRWIREYQQQIQPIQKEASVLREKGIYLITGGLGQVGQVLAHYLIDHYQARVILVGRKNVNSLTGKDVQFQRYQALQSKSDQVHYFSMDITLAEELEQLVLEIEKEYGKIDGVIHAAGVIGEDQMELIEDSTVDQTLRMLSPKVNGILNIYQAFKKRQPDFVWATSSVASFLGGLSFGAYAAGNSFMDSFITSISAEFPSWKSVELGEMTFTQEGIEREEKEDRVCMKPAELAALFEWSLTVPRCPVMAETIDNLFSRLKRVYAVKKEVEKEEIRPDGLKIKAEKPVLETPFIAAESDLEKKLIRMLELFFDFEPIGVDDNFFELGGDSLKAMVLLKRVEKEFGVRIVLSDLFENPSVRQIAGKLDQSLLVSQRNRRVSTKII